MYVPEHFRQADLSVIRAFVGEVAIAELVTWHGSGFHASTIPMILEMDEAGSGRLIGHLARANPQWRSLERGAPAVAIFRGPDGYISPAWYPTKRDDGRVVPTWNYASVQIHGTLLAHDADEWKLDLVTRLTAVHESARRAPWSVSDAPREYVDHQLRAIVGIELVIEHVEAKWKLGQNQPQQNRAGVLEGLRAEPTERNRRLAEFMESQPGV